MAVFFKLIRFPNLLIVAFTQLAMRLFIIKPILGLYGFELQMTGFDFSMLILATVAITAAGYVINDYFDRKPDIINKPQHVIVGRQMKRRTAMMLHQVLNGIGVLAGAYIAYRTGHLMFAAIFILAAGLLWFYSTGYKRQFLIGNLLVSLLTAAVPLLVMVFELPLLIREYGTRLQSPEFDVYLILKWILAFSIFAFLTSLIREIVKDTQDFEGDNAYGMRTMPIVLGIKNTKIIISIVTVITLTLILYVFFLYLNDDLTMVYMLVTIVIPFGFLIHRILVADSARDYKFASILLKVIMIAGILYAPLVSYIIHQNFLL